MTHLPTINRLHEVLYLDEATSSLFWKERSRDEFLTLRASQSWNGRYAGKAAGCAYLGYIRVSVDNKSILAHRIIWAMRNGTWPVEDIDHINHVRDDNSHGNLREVSRAENTRNQSLRKDNTSQVSGVSFLKNTGKWRAAIGTGKGKHLGCYDTKGDAIASRERELSRRGFHPNHGGLK